MTAFRQIPLSHHVWGLCVDAAMLRFTSAELTERTGITFSLDSDQLDWFKGAIVDREHAYPFALWDYFRAPTPGTMVIVMKQVQDMTAELADILRLLELRIDDVAWFSDEVDRERLSALMSEPDAPT